MRVVKSHSVDDADNERSETSARDLAQVLEQSGEAVIVKDLNAERGMVPPKDFIPQAEQTGLEHPGWKLPMI